MVKFLGSLGVAAASCLAAHAITGGGWKVLLVGLAACVFNGQVNLWQNPPVFGGKSS
ncbi:MAG TPA: hypothetical protein VFV60_04200 [bacterium]|nr:hypothetical protein [bacterium]